MKCGQAKHSLLTCRFIDAATALFLTSFFRSGPRSMGFIGLTWKIAKQRRVNNSHTGQINGRFEGVFHPPQLAIIHDESHFRNAVRGLNLVVRHYLQKLR